MSPRDYRLRSNRRRILTRAYSFGSAGVAHHFPLFSRQGRVTVVAGVLVEYVAGAGLTDRTHLPAHRRRDELRVLTPYLEVRTGPWQCRGRWAYTHRNAQDSLSIQTRFKTEEDS